MHGFGGVAALGVGFSLLSYAAWSYRFDAGAWALFGLALFAALAAAAIQVWHRRRPGGAFASSHLRSTASIIRDGATTHRRMRTVLYAVLLAFCANFALQSWDAHRTEESRRVGNATIELAAVQRMLSQRIPRLAVAASLSTSGHELQELRAAVDRSDLEAQRLIEQLDAQALGPLAEHPELRAAWESWAVQRTSMVAQARLLVGSIDRGEMRILATQAAAVDTSAEQALAQVQALLVSMHATAGQLHAARVRQTQLWAGVNVALLAMLAVFAIEPAVRSARRHYRRLATQAMDLQRMAMVAERTTNAVMIVDDGRRVVWVNQAFGRITGIAPEAAVGREALDLLGSLGGDAEGADRLQRSLDAGSGTRFQLQQRAADGQPIWLDVDLQPLQDDEGAAQGHVAVSADITELKLARADLRVAAIAFDSLDGIAITDHEQRILRVNAAFTRITGYDIAEVRGHTTGQLLRSGRHEPAFYEQMWQALERDSHWQGEVWNRRKSGEVYPLWMSITAVRDDDGRTINYVTTFADITEKKQADETIRSLAYYDPLTKLPNRRLLRERIDAAIGASARSGRHAALLFIDLDKFKALNDSKGHDVGDELLREVARRLSAGLRRDDTVARQGGDEFVVLVTQLNADAAQATRQAEGIAESIRGELNRPYMLGSYRHHSSPSIGVNLFVGAEHSVDELLKRADSAMYLAKRSGRNAFRFFDAEMHAALEQRVELESDLRRAHELGQLALHYQPQVDEGGRVRGAEVLLRWQHPTRGEVPPGVFVPLAEESELIVEIGHWVLEQAARQLAQWAAAPGWAGIELAVNVSARQFRRADFAATVSDIVARTGVQAGRLKLELTESMILADVDEVVVMMRQLRELGVKLSLDDFGTGQSSLAYLTRLPLDQLKIDQSFVRKLTHSHSDAVVVQTIIGLADNLGFDVIAEGVETEEQRELLQAMGCRHHQGYLFSRPLPLERFEAMVQDAAGDGAEAAAVRPTWWH